MKRVFIFILGLSLMFLIGCMKSVDIVDKDVLKLQKENDHFMVYSFEEDKTCIDDLLKTLESNYERITNDLGHELMEKIRIEIYPDITSFHKVIGRPDSPQWVVGTVYDNKILMVSPLNPGKVHNYNSLMQVVVHEFTHLICGQMNQNIYRSYIWLNEGIAVYEAQQMDDGYRKVIRKRIIQDNIPSLFQLNTKEFTDLDGYSLSYTIIEYLVQSYGKDTIKKIIISPNQIEQILGTSKPELEQGWLEYLNKNYAN